MAIEIERKFLVVNLQQALAASHASLHIVQGYLGGKGMHTRVRITNNSHGHLAVKGPRYGISRSEFEYEIPLRDARELLSMAGDCVLEKTRHLVKVGPQTWEVDVFGGRHAGIVVAEVELQHTQEVFQIPAWAGEEVTATKHYRNKRLATLQMPLYKQAA